jgi:MFS family permease
MYERNHSISTWVPLGLFAVAYILSFMNRQIVAVNGAVIREVFELSQFQLGLLYGTAFSVVYAVSGLFMGWLADRWSRIGLITLGVLGWSAASLSGAFAQTFGMLVAGRLALGVFQSMLSPAVHAYMADRFDVSRRATVFSIYSSAIFVGIALSFLIGGSVAQWLDWRWAMAMVAAPGFVVALGLWGVGTRSLGVERETWQEGDAGVRDEFESGVESVVEASAEANAPLGLTWIANPSLWLHLVGFSAMAMIGYTMLAFMGSILAETHDRSDLIPMLGWFFFGVALMNIVSGRFADRLANRSGALRYIPALVALLGVPSYVGGVFAASPTATFWLFGLGLWLCSSYNGLAAGLIQMYVPDSVRGQASALYLFVISMVGLGIGPALAGQLADTFTTQGLGNQALPMALTVVIVSASILAAGAFLIAIQRYHKDAVEG